MRWGIPDVEAWLASIDPRIIDRWLAFHRIEPEAFGESPASEQDANPKLMDAREAVKRMSQRL